MEIEILRLQAKQLLSEYMNLDKISANIGLLLCVQTLFQVEFNRTKIWMVIECNKQSNLID